MPAAKLGQQEYECVEACSSQRCISPTDNSMGNFEHLKQSPSGAAFDLEKLQCIASQHTTLHSRALVAQSSNVLQQ